MEANLVTHLKIVKWPAKVLETKAEEVTVFDENLKQTVSDMHQTMLAENGIGLAANQVNLLQRIFVVNIPWVDGDDEEEKEIGMVKHLHSSILLLLIALLRK